MGSLRYVISTIVVIIISIIVVVASVLIGVHMGSRMTKTSQTTTNISLPLNLAEKHLEAINISFHRQVSSDGTKMTVKLTIILKNAGDKPIYIKQIEVPDARWTKKLDMRLEPGEIRECSLVILRDIPYTIVWEIGQTHTVKIKFQIEGYESTLTVNFKGSVE